VYIAAIPASQIAVTIISFEEQIRGPLAQIRRANNEARIILAYQLVRETLDYFTTGQVLDFYIAATHQLRQLRQQRIRVGTQDLRIAAIALANNCVVVTRNQRDFGRVPGLVIEDWSQ
jgi:tRNA(fMet)-specific endonuclease VapC